MSTKIDASGRRYVQSETEVQGTPEEIWQAIATGPGVSSWFVPCQIEEREGGKIVASFGPGMDSESTITAWDPPHSFRADGGEIAPGGPAMATEWTVEARSGGTCLVRVVHSWFAETDEWDGQFEGTEHGWPAFFRDLALYLKHFKAQTSSTFQLIAMAPQSADEAWSKLTTALGLAGKSVGDAVQATEGAPKLSGRVEYVDGGECLVLSEQPGPGIAHCFAFDMGRMAYISLRVFIFGIEASETVSREESAWSSWLAETFPMPEPAGA